MFIQAGPGAHAAICTIGTGSLWVGGGMLTTHPTKVACGLDLYLHLPSVPAGACRGVTLTFSSIHEYILKIPISVLRIVCHHWALNHIIPHFRH